MTNKKLKHIILKYLIVFIIVFIPFILNHSYIENKDHYYYDFVIAFTICAISFELTGLYHNYLNRKFPFERFRVKRLIIQISTTILFGLFFLNIVAVIYSKYYLQITDIWLFDKTDTTFVIFIGFIVNGYYFGIQFYNTFKKTNESLISFANQKKKETNSGFIIVQSLENTIQFKYDEIATIFLENRNIFLLTFEKKQFLLNDSISYFEGNLPVEFFFRINRQLLVNKKNIKSFKSLEYGKLEVYLITEESTAVVSQRSASKFRNWFKTIN